jgi:CheY-like chemotaxis protein
VGRGSRFYFALELPTAAEGTAGLADAELDAPPLDARLAPGQDVTALVVDDSTVNRRILAALLESAGVRVITAAGGREAIELAPQHRPDIIFMDLKMDDLDGLEATRRIHSNPATAAIPVIAVTASALRDSKNAAREAGCVDYLAKPVRAESMFKALQTHLGVRFTSGVAERPAPERLELPAGSWRAPVAARLREAVAIGDVTSLEALVRELTGGTPPEAALGQRITRLVAEFDFDGLRDLAASLSTEKAG